jgi:hypothetical protein
MTRASVGRNMPWRAQEKNLRLCPASYLNEISAYNAAEPAPHGIQPAAPRVPSPVRNPGQCHPPSPGYAATVVLPPSVLDFLHIATRHLRDWICCRN